MGRLFFSISIILCSAQCFGAIFIESIEADATHPVLASMDNVKVPTGYEWRETYICGGSNPSDAPIGGCYVRERVPTGYKKMTMATIDYNSVLAGAREIKSTDETVPTDEASKEVLLPFKSKIFSLEIQHYVVVGATGTVYECGGGTDAPVCPGQPQYDPKGSTPRARLVIVTR